MVLSSIDQHSNRVVEDPEHKEEQEENNPIDSVKGGLCKAKLKERREFVELDNVMHEYCIAGNFKILWMTKNASIKMD